MGTDYVYQQVGELREPNPEVKLLLERSHNRKETRVSEMEMRKGKNCTENIGWVTSIKSY